MKITSQDELQARSEPPSRQPNVRMELNIGDPAPDFKATAVGGIYGGGQNVKLADFAGSTLVLYFYPQDETPGCTAQACDLRDSWRELQSKVELFGVSTDSVESRQKFIQKHGLPFPLLSDPDREMVKAYQAWAEQGTHGNKQMATERTTYLIGPDQKIKAILKNVKPAEHVTQLLKALRALLPLVKAIVDEACDRTKGYMMLPVTPVRASWPET